jgi:CRISPR-associated protein Cmr1
MPNEFSVTLKTLTPLFLGGADPRGDEIKDGYKMRIREPSIRGALRYWLRTVCGPHSDIERKTFGSPTEGGDVAIACDGMLNTSSAAGIFSANSDQTSYGKRYLYWSMNESERQQYDQRRYADPGQTVTVHFSTPYDESGEGLRYAQIALWLFTHFGGLGSRSRRCGGNLAVTSAEDLPLKELPFIAPDKGSQQQWSDVAVKHLSEGLKVSRAFCQNASGFHNDVDAFKSPSKAWVIEPKAGSPKWDNLDAAIAGIGGQLGLFRPDKPEPRAAASRPWEDRIAFGLPLNPKHGQVKIESTGRENIERRNSPLWLRIFELSNDQFIGVATLFESTFLPSETRLSQVDPHREASKPIRAPSSYSLLADFVTSCFYASPISIP